MDKSEDESTEEKREAPDLGSSPVNFDKSTQTFGHCESDPIKNDHFSSARKTADIGDAPEDLQSSSFMPSKEQILTEIITLIASDINETNNESETALILAVKHQCHDVINSLLLNPGCNVNAKNSHGNTAFHVTCYNNNEYAAKQLLNHKDIDILSQNDNKETCVHVSFKYRILLDRISKSPYFFNALSMVDKEGETPFSIFVKQFGDCHLFNEDFWTCHDLWKSFTLDQTSFNLAAHTLAAAVEMSTLSVCKFLVERGADIDSSYSHGDTAMLLALRIKSVDKVKLLYRENDLQNSKYLKYAELTDCPANILNIFAPQKHHVFTESKNTTNELYIDAIDSEPLNSILQYQLGRKGIYKTIATESENICNVISKAFSQSMHSKHMVFSTEICGSMAEETCVEPEVDILCIFQCIEGLTIREIIHVDESSPWHDMCNEDGLLCPVQVTETFIAAFQLELDNLQRKDFGQFSFEEVYIDIRDKVPCLILRWLGDTSLRVHVDLVPTFEEQLIAKSSRHNNSFRDSRIKFTFSTHRIEKKKIESDIQKQGLQMAKLLRHPRFSFGRNLRILNLSEIVEPEAIITSFMLKNALLDVCKICTIEEFTPCGVANKIYEHLGNMARCGKITASLDGSVILLCAHYSVIDVSDGNVPQAACCLKMKLILALCENIMNRIEISNDPLQIPVEQVSKAIGPVKQGSSNMTNEDMRVNDWGWSKISQQEIQETNMFLREIKHVFDFIPKYAREGNILKAILEQDTQAVNAVDSGLKTLLMYACEQSYFSAAKVLLENGADVYMKDKYGRHALQFAVGNRIKFDLTQLVKLLIEKNSSIVNNCDDNSVAPLMNACKHTKAHVIELMLKSGACLEVLNREGLHAIHYACMNKDHGSEIVHLLNLHGKNSLNLMDKSGGTPLMTACKHANKSLVQYLIAKGARLDMRDEDGNHAVHFACMNKDHGSEIMQILIQYEKDSVSLTDKSGWTPLMTACKHANKSLVQYLLKKGARLDMRAEDGRHAVHFACINEDHGSEIMQILIQYDKDSVSLTDKSGWTPLMFACDLANISLVQYLIEKGVLLGMRDKVGNQAVHFACMNIDHGSEMVQLLILHDKDSVNVTGKKGLTPLMAACQHANKSLVQYLIEEGARLDMRDEDGNHAVHFACMNKDHGSEIIHFLILHKKVSLNLTDKSGETPLMVACQNSCKSLVQFLIDKEARLDMRDGYGNHAVHFACKNKDHGSEIVHLLIQHEKDSVNFTKNSGRTPLMVACKKSNKSLVQYLIKNGARLDMSDNVGNQAVHFACMNKDHGSEIVQLLIRYEKDSLNVTSKSGRTPLMTACEHTNKSLVQLLIDRGARVDQKDNRGRQAIYFARKNKHHGSVIVQMLPFHG